MENNFPRSGRGRGHSQRKSQEDGMAEEDTEGIQPKGLGGGGGRVSRGWGEEAPMCLRAVGWNHGAGRHVSRRP